MSNDNDLKICQECGIEISGGREGCQALFDELGFQSLADPRIGALHDLAFDTYCIQHFDSYCTSAKSYMAHLTRLCVGIEYSGDHAVYAALQRVYSEKPLTKPDILPLDQRGTLRISDVMAITDIPTRADMIRKWAANVWEAYASQHQIARDYVAAALKANPSHRTRR